MNPFDPRTAILAKHAQHVVLIHFPIALFIAGVAFDFIATWTRRKELALVAYYNFSAALLTAFPAIVTGLMAWQLELEGRRLKGILLMHLIAGCTSLALIAAVWWVQRRSFRQSFRTADSRLPAWRWALELLGLAAVAITGHLGGFLSGVNHP